MVQVPAGLMWWTKEPSGAAWLERLPGLVEECVEAWSLQMEGPFDPLHIAFVAAVRLADGRPAVLKLNKPEAESEHEGQALAHWDGEGAVRLLRQDLERQALLLERCEPGFPLRRLPEREALDVAAYILRGFRRPAPAVHPYRLLRDLADEWRQKIPER